MSDQAPAMLHSFLANFFIPILCHGYVPSTLRDAILLPIPKGHKDPSDSSNYRGIALASCVSKVLKWYIILTWGHNIYFVTDDLQFCLNLVILLHWNLILRAVVNCCVKWSSHIYTCLIHASKTVDTVNHHVLFKKC